MMQLFSTILIRFILKFCSIRTERPIQSKHYRMVIKICFYGTQNLNCKLFIVGSLYGGYWIGVGSHVPSANFSCSCSANCHFQITPLPPRMVNLIGLKCRYFPEICGDIPIYFSDFSANFPLSRKAFGKITLVHVSDLSSP